MAISRFFTPCPGQVGYRFLLGSEGTGRGGPGTSPGPAPGHSRAIGVPGRPAALGQVQRLGQHRPSPRRLASTEQERPVVGESLRPSQGHRRVMEGHSPGKSRVGRIRVTLPLARAARPAVTTALGQRAGRTAARGSTQSITCAASLSQPQARWAVIAGAAQGKMHGSSKWRVSLTSPACGRSPPQSESLPGAGLARLGNVD